MRIFLELMRCRRSIRNFKPNPIPADYITKILDAAHYAMSGGNCQPWEFIVVKDPETKRKIVDAYIATGERVWSLEQQRMPEYRFPAFNFTSEEKDKAIAAMGGWGLLQYI
jgi:nitroreductase